MGDLLIQSMRQMTIWSAIRQSIYFKWIKDIRSAINSQEMILVFIQGSIDFQTLFLSLNAYDVCFANHSKLSNHHLRNHSQSISKLFYIKIVRNIVV